MTVAVASLFGGCAAWAEMTDGALRIEVVTAHNLVVDSNAGTPSSYAPRSAYVGVTFHNDGTAPLTDVMARIGDYKDGVGDTPGLYPSRVHGGLTGPLAGGAFALTHEGGSAGRADATRYLATLAPGASVTVYWLISYPRLDVNGTPTWGPSVKPDDDLWLEYDVWATAEERGLPRQVDLTRKVSMRNEISASANKILPNGANKVPDYYKDLFNQYVPAWTNVATDGTVGSQITVEGVWYYLGNVGEGFDSDGDLVPEHNAWMQPVGDPSLFDAGAFRLVRTYAMVVVKRLGGGEQVLVGENQLYFENIPANTDAIGYVRYEFVPVLAGARSVLTPYQEVASGCDNEKFNADFGAALGGSLISYASHAQISKRADVNAVAPGGQIGFSVAFTNGGAIAVGNPALGVPLVVQDAIPPGTVYVAASAAAGIRLPAGVSGVRVLYSSDGGASWTSAEPADAASVTHIQWWLSDPLPAGAAGAVGLSVEVAAPYTLSAPSINNVAALSFGGGAPFATAGASTRVLGGNTLGGTVFLDSGTGTGGYCANGLRDGDEPGLAGIRVDLYRDTDGDGVLDAGEPQADTAVTGGDGRYAFTGLLDGNYLTVADADDAGLPAGCVLTTAGALASAVDPSGQDASGVVADAVCFGFASALTVEKSHVGPSDLREGQQVTYLLAVTNRLAGDGSGVSASATYTTWGDALDAAHTGAGNKGWSPADSACSSAGPDGQYAVAVFEDANEQIAVTGFSLGAQPGAIRTVNIVAQLRVQGTFRTTPPSQTETLTVRLYNTATGVAVVEQEFACSNLASGVLAVDVSSARSWQWPDFSGNAFSIQLAGKAGGGKGFDGSVAADAIGFRVTSDQMVGAASPGNTLSPVPLIDTFDASRLRFISASVAPDTVSTNGVGTLAWNNLGPIYAGGGRCIGVTFTVLQPPGNVAAPVTNTVAVTNACFANGHSAGAVQDQDVAAVSPAGTIGDTVWRDLDGDGVRQAGEPGVPGVTVSLAPPAGVDLGAGTNQPATTVTDRNGSYLFAGLPASGTYTVAVATATLPGGAGTPTADRDGTATPGSASVPVVCDSATGADTVLDADFGYRLPTTLRGTVWHDLDRAGDPVPEPGDDRFAGVIVRLYAADGATLAAATATLADGTFLFPGIAAGTYVVRIDAATGVLGAGSWARAYDSDGVASADEVVLTVAAAGQGVADFSYYCHTGRSLGGKLFYDWDGNGVHDGADEGIAGAVVRLYQDENGNGVVDVETDAFLAEASTTSAGSYVFGDLPAGTYQIAVDEYGSFGSSLYSYTCDPQGEPDGVSVVTLSGSDNLSQDFGYRPYGKGSIGDVVWYDSNGDGVQFGFMESGISNVTVSLYADLDGDGNYFPVRATTTEANGAYLFSALPDGAYRVEVDASSPALPVDGFGNGCRATTATMYDRQVPAEVHLGAAFGFVLPGATGDTVYWDFNGNGDQDWTEPGIPGVIVRMYRDANVNGVYDDGEAQVETAETDAAGKYIFEGLLPGRYVVAVDTACAAVAGATLTADPDNDGTPCPSPAVAGISCDAQCGVLVIEEATFRGADFGYRPAGVLGDSLWVDLNGNGARDAGEQGIPYVEVGLYSGTGRVASCSTDVDGQYSFGNLADGTYRVEVDVGDPDFPADLTSGYDADGAPDGVANGIIVSGGHVVSIGGQPAADADLAIDFGYRYAGGNRVSGTLGLDAEPYDGLLNGGALSGAGAGEYPFAGATVLLHLWRDDGDDVPETGEMIRIASTCTAAHGDYVFGNLPDGQTGSRYIVALAAPAGELKLTTETGDTSAIRVVASTNFLGITLSAYQVLEIVPERGNVDFAFAASALRDFGDLPTSYSTTVADQPAGPSHAVVSGNDLWLGGGVTAESNGQPSASATGDGADDGVAAVGRWRDGAGGGTVTVTVGAGSGWLAGWVDFNQDGTFTNANERVAGFPVSSATNSGVYTLTFDVPDGTFRTDGPTLLNARFRLYACEPALATFSGQAAGGEVEDYQFPFGIIGDLAWDDLNANGQQDDGESGISNVTVRLYAANGHLLESAVTDADGSYAFTGLPAADYSVTFTSPCGKCYTLNSASKPAGADQKTLTPVNAADSDESPLRGVVSLTGNLDRRDIDAGLYESGVLEGYLFVDRNGDLLRGTGDASITNALVRLTVNGVAAASTNSDAQGHYQFSNVSPGTVSVLVSRASAVLIDVPDTNDPARNRALADALGADAYIPFSLVSGYGVLAERPGETLNFGFADYPLSTAFDLSVYASGDAVMIDLWTVDEAGNADIEVYAWLNNAWTEVGRVPSNRVVGEGANRYTVQASGLTADGAYYFKVVDEAGHVHYSDGTVAVHAIRVEAVRLEMQTLTLSFNTDKGRPYTVWVSTDLVNWTAEHVSYPTARGWSEYTDEPFTANGAQTQVRVPVNGRHQAFFKIVRSVE